jgi:hypothetical protein
MVVWISISSQIKITQSPSDLPLHLPITMPTYPSLSDPFILFPTSNLGFVCTKMALRHDFMQWKRDKPCILHMLSRDASIQIPGIHAPHIQTVSARLETELKLTPHS